MLIHGGRPSPFTRKVLTILEEKGMSYEQKDLSPIPKTPELLAMNPIGLIPVLEHEGTFIPDSSVICAYIGRLQPEPAVYPAEAKEYARALFLEEFADTKLRDAVGPVFFERFVKVHVFEQEADEARVGDALAALPPIFDYFESQLEVGAETLLPKFGIADVALGAQLGSLAIVGEGVDAAHWPKLANYTRAVLSRDSVVAATES